MSNQINELSPEIRDFLLNRNLIVSDTVSNNGLSNVAVGLGQQAFIENSGNAVQASADLEESAIDFRESLVLRNRYTSFEDMVQATIIDNSFAYQSTDGGYIEENGELNIGGPSTDALDIITSITSQEGFGLGEGGFFPQNNINTSITGRVLGGVGAINDTPLGIIGAEQLLLAFKQKLAFNTQRELFGKVNLQPFSLLRGADFINPDYSITVSSSTGGRILDTALDLSGFELPLSKLDAGASIFEDTDLFQADSIQRNNAMIRNTGKGQILRLFEGLNQNKFKPAYESDRNDDRLGVQDALEYQKPTFNLNDATNFDTFETVEITGDQIWSSEVDLVNEDTSLIFKTKQLFNDDLKLYNAMFNRQGIQDLSRTNELTTPNAKDDNSDKWLSKGSGVLSEEFLNGGGADNVFCRTWTSKVSYDNIQALQKNKGLQGSDAFPNQFRRNEGRSVLDSNGFVKISPYNLPEDAQQDADYAKKFMFSIENLAWNDEIYNVPNYETGPGDPVSGTKGRIMWFPPYDMKFEENTSVKWDTTEFIGRGEPIYTYNNTVRGGTLSWKIIIDHPNYLNDLNSLNSDQIIASIAAGCSEYKTFFSPSEIDQIVSEVNSSVPAGKTSTANSVETPDPIIFYFPNDVGSLFDGYEVTGSGLDQSSIPSEEGFNSTAGTLYDNGTNQGLNDPWNDSNNISTIKEFLSENSGYKLVLNSYASTAGRSDANQTLSDVRLENVRRWLFENIALNLTIEKAVSNGSTQSSSDPNGQPSADNARKERKVTVEFIYDPALDTRITEQVEVETEPRQTDRTIVPKVKRRFHKESDYFEKLGNSTSGTDKFIYQKIQEKIKFFQPAFHSTTPEGFNSRLTFLQQCTRQGPTEVTRRASNLAFGAPPVCILRVGDFYNTKIIIESLNFKFEPLVWDLNPEGVGVQPMIANVSIGFKFIGGSSLTGPINRLQNAVSFNYFANTEVYDPRAAENVPVKNADGTIGYVTSGDTKNLRDFLDEDEYRDKVNKSSNQNLDNNQEAQAEVANSTQSEASVSAKTDLDILRDIAWTVTFNEVVQPNTFSFTWNAATPLSNLSKTYNYILTIKNENGAPQQVLSGTFGPSTLNTGDNTSTTIWSQAIYGIGFQSFTLSFSGNGIFDKRTQILDPETGFPPS